MYIPIGTLLGAIALALFCHFIDKRKGTGLKGIYKQIYIACREYIEKFADVTAGEIAPKIKERLLRYNNRPDYSDEIDCLALTLLYNTAAEELATGYYHSFGDLTLMGKEIQKLAYQTLSTSLNKGYITQEDYDACAKDLRAAIEEAG